MTANCDRHCPYCHTGVALNALAALLIRTAGGTIRDLGFDRLREQGARALPKNLRELFTSVTTWALDVMTSLIP